jgi:hypothetical protein
MADLADAGEGADPAVGRTPTPKRCPLCSSPLTARWIGVATHSRRGFRARAYPVHLCPRCGVAVQIRRVTRPSHATRTAARAGQARRIRAMERRFREGWT